MITTEEKKSGFICTVTTAKVVSDSFLLSFERPTDQSDVAKTKRAGYGRPTMTSMQARPVRRRKEEML